jgi:dihydropteroate synthase
LHGTIGAALSLASQGVQIIRVHDIKPVREALLLFEASGGIDGQEANLT